MSRTTFPLVVVAFAALAALAACDREQRRFAEPGAEATAQAPRQSRLVPGTSPSPDPSAPAHASPPSPGTSGALRARAGESPYDDNAYAIGQGKRLFVRFNCVGCHGHGGGGMGPALMDDVWRYGHAPESIYESIVAGRPNGMPSFGGRIPEQQVWQLVAYVRSMSVLVRGDAAPGRQDGMHPGEPELRRDRREPRREAAAPGS